MGYLAVGPWVTFHELNRAREAASSMPVLSYPLNPQMHGIWTI